MKIDTSKIEGYNEMSAEEKLKALEAYELEGYVKKDILDKTTSELASTKKQLQERMSEQEKLEQQVKEENEKMKQELEELRKEKAIQEHTAQFLALGYEKELADKTAKALYEGDMKTVFEAQKSFNEKLLKDERAKLLKDTPTPPNGDGNNPITKDILNGMSIAEEQKFAKEHPTEYAELYKR